MCEFTAFLNNKVVAKDIVFARLEGKEVVVKDVLGMTNTIKNCKIIEVDVNSERLVLASA